MFALLVLIIMYSGAFWYTPPPKKQRKQFRFVEKTLNNETYERKDLL